MTAAVAKSPESSELESDEGASPSLSDSESSSSSGSSDNSSFKRVNPTFSTPKKRLSQTQPINTRVTRKRSTGSVSKSNVPSSAPKRVKPSKKPRPTPSKMLLRSSNTRKKARNKRRRTKSERNRQAGKPDNLEVSGNRPEDAVALDAEIDRVLEEKAVKNNLTTTNVKNIIRQVITNNMVRRMIVQTVSNKNSLDSRGSSGDETFYEPTLTRAKTKELMEKQSPLWPIVATPVKVLKKSSETHMLITQDLPEDSSGDEEYVPKETELHLSEDESGSITSHASDIGSPMPIVATPKDERWLHCSNEFDIQTPKHNSMFKTPPPKKKPKDHVDSAIGLRTRSKLPLTDTTIETLEMQLIPPDITTDMYHWGESDNEDYLAFLKDFLLPAQVHNENVDDDEADPEYNVMEDEEDDHDREEHRMDRAVKVSKKELNELVAELFDVCPLSSGDEIDDLQGIQSIATYDKSVDSSFTVYERPSFISESSFGQQTTTEKVEHKLNNSEKEVSNYPPVMTIDTVDVAKESTVLPLQLKPIEKGNLCVVKTKSKDEFCKSSTVCVENEPLFSKEAIEKLQHQLRQHIQLLAQTYVLTASRDHPSLNSIAKDAKNMIMSLVRFADSNGSNSVFAVENLKYSQQICSEWSQSLNVKSPIKKKILEERFMNDEESGERNEFPLRVIKLIAESPAFMYPSLLPITYRLDNSQKLPFTKSEDRLIILGYDQIKSMGGKFTLTSREISAMISEIIIPTRTAGQIYARIRNMRRSMTSGYKDNLIQKYFKGNIIPEPNYIGFDDRLAIAPKDQPIEKCSALWQHLINRLTYKPSYLLPRPSRKRKNAFRKLDFEKKISVEKKEQVPVPKINLPIQHSPDVTPIALLNSVGTPGAYLLIPNYALAPQNSCDIPKEFSDEKVLPMDSPGLDATVQSSSQDDTTTKVTDFTQREHISMNEVKDKQSSSARTRVYIRGSKSWKMDKESTSDSEDDISQGYYGSLRDTDIDESDPESEDLSHNPIAVIDIADEACDSDTQSNSQRQSKNPKNDGNAKDGSGNKRDETKTNESKGGIRPDGGGGAGEDDDEDKRPRRVRNPGAPDDDTDDNAKKDDTDEDEHEERLSKKRTKFDSSPSGEAVKISSTKVEHTAKASKKLKRSPAGPSKKRPSKYNVPSSEKLLEEVENDYQNRADVEDAFSDAFLGRVQTTVEAKNPAVYNSFVQLLCDYGENPVPEVQLYNKVSLLLKDYSDLVKEFGSMLRSSSPEIELYDFEYSQETEAQINFMTLLNKWTAESPQLRNKILQKMKLLREDPKMTERDVIDMADTLFLKDPVMTKAFQDLFLEIFRPQPTSSSTDFEEINLELEDTFDSGDDMHTEIVKIPEETCVPATTTCPCVCHSNSSDVSYASKSKHCHKCSLKFQDGKVFVHHGRVMRPVNITMASPGSAKKILSGAACVRCVQTLPKISSCAKESPSPPVKKLSKFPPPIISTEVGAVEDCARITDESSDKLGDFDGDLEEGEIVDEEEVKGKCEPPTETGANILQRSSNDETAKPLPDDVNEKPSTSASIRHSKKSSGNLIHEDKCKVWTMEEDKLILKTCQAEGHFSSGLEKLENLLPYRRKEEIKSRLMELINILQAAVRSGKMEEQGKGSELRK